MEVEPYMVFDISYGFNNTNGTWSDRGYEKCLPALCMLMHD